MTNIEQTKSKIYELKHYISGRIASIESLLDRSGYHRGSDDNEELIEELDVLESQHSELRSLESEIEHVESKRRLIDQYEDQIENIELYDVKDKRIPSIKEEIKKLTREREQTLKEIGRRIAAVKSKVR